MNLKSQQTNEALSSLFTPPPPAVGKARCGGEEFNRHPQREGSRKVKEDGRWPVLLM